MQSALLEAMQERQVTIGDESYPLPEPFMVLATQNPIEQEGTYPLPEAQIDRFMLKLKVTYPSKADEREILKRMARSAPDTEVEQVLDPADIVRLRSLIDEFTWTTRSRNTSSTSSRPRATRLLTASISLICCVTGPPRARRSFSPWRQGAGLPRRPRLRQPAGRQDHRSRRIAPPRHRQLRGRGGRENLEDMVQQIFDTVEVP